MEHSEHDPQGTPSGEFAQFVDVCRSKGREASERLFGPVRYKNASSNRLLPLYDCRVERLEIVGQFLYRTWENVTILRGDLSHSGGIMFWTRVRAETVSLKSCRATMFCVDSVFRACDFKLSNLADPVFIRCVFTKVKFRELNLIRARFVACEFSDVDLTGSTWQDVGELQISGSWTGTLADDSDARAVEFFSLPR